MNGRLSVALVVGLAAAHAAPGSVPSFDQEPAPAQAVANRRELKGTDGPVFGLAWSPDGRTLAAAGYRQVNLWRLDDTAPPRTFLAHTDLVRSVAWSPDGVRIASVGDDGVARVWNAESLQQLSVLETGPDYAIGWSPDGSRLATAGASATLKIWRSDSGALLHRARLQTTISSLRWSPDGTSVVVGGINGMTTLWDADTGRLVGRMYVSWPARNDVNGVTWSPPGGLVAMAHGARGVGGVTLWNPATGTVAHTLTSAGGWLRGISWSPDGQWLAVGGEDGTVRVQDVTTSEIAATLPTDSKPVWSVAWSPDGRRLAAGNTGTAGPPRVGGTITVWEEPVRVLQADSATARARAVETELLARRVTTPAASRPTSIATVFTEGGAYGTVVRLEPPFGNLETSVTESDLESLKITPGRSFHLRCRGQTFTMLFGQHWADVARGEWVAYASMDGYVVVARNAANAAEASGCQPGDEVFVARPPG
jgi:WD40 repeat protein